MIYFTDKNHEYISEKKEKYTSVSSLIDTYKPKYDTDYWSKYKALEEVLPNFQLVKKEFLTNKASVHAAARDMDSIKFQKVIDKFKAKWADKSSKSSKKGTVYHKDREKMAYIRGLVQNPFTKTNARVIKVEKSSTYDNQSASRNLFDLVDGFYPELLLWNSEYRIAGQSDKVYIETIGNIRYVDIDDYKTNNKIDYQGYRGERMLDPVSHLQNCNFINYSLKISAYAWMLEQFGFVVRNLGFHHFNTLHTVEYLKEDLERILKLHYYKNCT